MAKRRFRNAEEPEAAPESLTPEQRRARRRRDRELLRRGKQPPTGRSSRLRRGLLLSIPVIVIAAVLLIFAFTNLLQTPCIQFQPIPQSSGLPAFPPHNTTDFSTTWCPPGVGIVMHLHPYIKIDIEGQTVGIPPTQQATAQNPDYPSIGRNSSYPNNFPCDLPIHTHPPDPALGFPDGVVHIESPWPYIYNLTSFFYVWQQSFSGVFVNSSHPNQPIVYQPNELLGFTADATHKVELFVDGNPSSAAGSLELNTLDYVASPYPSCVATVYGTGHTILLEYVAISPAVRGTGLHPVTLATAGPDSMQYLVSLGGPLQKSADGVAESTAQAHAEFASLHWLSLRGSSA